MNSSIYVKNNSGRKLSPTGTDLSKLSGTDGEAEEKLEDHMQKEIDYLEKQGYTAWVTSRIWVKITIKKEIRL